MSPRKNTQESLGIFWRGEEVPGFTLYAYFPRLIKDLPPMDLSIFDKDSVEHRSTLMKGSDWSVALHDFKVHTWPAKKVWPGTIEASLRSILGEAGLVAWGAINEMYNDPPDLFHPDSMSGSLWTYLKSNGEFLLTAQMDEEFACLGDSKLLELREYCRFSH